MIAFCIVIEATDEVDGGESDLGEFENCNDIKANAIFVLQYFLASFFPI